MPKKNKVIREVYEGYRNDSESHLARAFALFFVSTIIAVYAENLADTALPAMALAVSVLAGFTFTALFSSGSLSTHDLPPLKDESDRQDRVDLDAMSTNFRARARLFLTSAVACLALILVLSISISWSTVTHHLSVVGLPVSGDIVSIGRKAYGTLSTFVILLTFLLFSEMLYLFYRLSESIFAILELRRKYLAAREKSDPPCG